MYFTILHWVKLILNVAYAYIADLYLFDLNFFDNYVVVRTNVTTAEDFSAEFLLPQETNLSMSTGLGFTYSGFDYYVDCIWVCGDILIILLSLIIRDFFRKVNSGIAAAIKGGTNSEIRRLKNHHKKVCKLVKVGDHSHHFNFLNGLHASMQSTKVITYIYFLYLQDINWIFSPLVIINYVWNIGYLFARLYEGLENIKTFGSFLIRFTNIYAFIFLLFKIFLPTYLAAMAEDEVSKDM